MSRILYFITHPNVVISREVPIPQWPLSEVGCRHMEAGLRHSWWKAIDEIVR